MGLILFVAMYNDLKPGQDRGIFERVQYGVPLNQAGIIRNTLVDRSSILPLALRETASHRFTHVKVRIHAASITVELITRSWIAQLTLTHVSVDGGLASQLSDYIFFPDTCTFTIILDWETKRGRDFLCMAQLVYCCVLEVDDPAPSEKKLEIWLKTCPLDKALAKNIDSTLRAILTIATTKRLNAVFKEGAKVAPVEFVYIGMLMPCPTISRYSPIL